MAGPTLGFSLSVLTINTHKGFMAFNRHSILPELRNAMRNVNADVVCLQEVMGAHKVYPLHIENWPDTTHYEFLADVIRSDYVYGRNTVYPEGHHGNVVLPCFPVEYYENRDISVGNSEKRGLLYCRIMPSESDVTVHVICVRLGLHVDQQQAQLTMLTEWVSTLLAGESVVVVGDFNGRRQQANQPLKAQAGLEEIFARAHGRSARTFSVSLPLLRLGRVCVKNAHASHPKALALKQRRHLLDHASLSMEIHL